MSQLMQLWRLQKGNAYPGFTWLRSLRPPPMHLGTAQLAVLRGHEQSVTSVDLSSNGQWLISASHDGTMRAWDSETYKELFCLRGHKGQVLAVALTPDDKRIASGGGEGRTLSADGRRFTTVADHTVRIWDAKSGFELHCLHGHEGPVTSLAFSDDGRLLASGSIDKTVRIWDSERGIELLCLRGHKKDVASVAFSPEGTRIASSSGSHKHKGNTFPPDVRIWDATSGNELARLNDNCDVMSVAWSPDGRKVATASNSTVQVWEVETKLQVLRMQGHKWHITCVAYSQDGRCIASSSESWDNSDNTVRVWDTQTGFEANCFRGHEANVNSVMFFPCGSRIVSASTDCTLRVWNVAGDKLRTLPQHESRVLDTAYSPDGTLIVSGSHASIMIWNANTGEAVSRIEPVGYFVEGVRFSSDGMKIIGECGDWDNWERMELLWDASSGQRIWETELVSESDKPTMSCPTNAEAGALETMVTDSATGQCIAWFPPVLGSVRLSKSVNEALAPIVQAQAQSQPSLSRN